MKELGLTAGKKNVAPLEQVAPQGKTRLAQGFSIVIFPEGTRAAPGIRGTYQAGGALLATQTGAPVLPVAHNAGNYWRRHAFVKYPGVVTVSIGPLVRSEGMKAADLMRAVEHWIENEMARIRRDEAR